IDVDDVGAQRMALDLPNQRPRLLAVDSELDEGALGLDARERFLERQRIHDQRLCGPAVAVDHCRNLLLEARLPRRAFARFLTGGCRECYCLRHTSVLYRASFVVRQSKRELTDWFECS